MPTPRFRWWPPGTARLVTMVLLVSLVVGASLVSARGDPARRVADEGARSPLAQTEGVGDADGEPSTSADSEETSGRGDEVSPESVRVDSPQGQASGEPVSVSVVAGERLITEAAPALFTLTRAGDIRGALTVAVQVEETGSMLAGAPPTSVTFQPGERTATLAVAMADDAVVDATSRVEVTISGGPGYAIAPSAGTATTYVADNDRIFLLPDLVSDAPIPEEEPVAIWWNEEAMLVLRFTGYVTNRGEGPLDLTGNPQLADPNDDTSHDVWQRVRTTTGDWVQLTRPPGSLRDHR